MARGGCRLAAAGGESGDETGCGGLGNGEITIAGGVAGKEVGGGGATCRSIQAQSYFAFKHPPSAQGADVEMMLYSGLCWMHTLC